MNSPTLSSHSSYPELAHDSSVRNMFLFSTLTFIWVHMMPMHGILPFRHYGFAPFPLIKNEEFTEMMLKCGSFKMQRSESLFTAVKANCACTVCFQNRSHELPILGHSQRRHCIPLPLWLVLSPVSFPVILMDPTHLQLMPRSSSS
jgi:hypothetical protein